MEAVFSSYSSGVKTGCDAWAYNYSSDALAKNMRSMIAFFNKQVGDFMKSTMEAKDFIDTDPRKISWSANLLSDMKNGRSGKFSESSIYTGCYRPFAKQHVYFHRQFNQRVYRMPPIFPEPGSMNRVICVCGPGAGKGFSGLMVESVPNLHFHDSSQCFPLYVYDERRDGEMDFGSGDDSRHINVSDYVLGEFQASYSGTTINKEDIFYYVYGVLHSPEYKRRFKADLKKMLPRIPKAKDFWAFAKAGRTLADIHLGYEDAKPYPAKEHSTDLGLDPSTLYHVQKMYFGKSGKQVDKSTIVYNSRVTLTDIPLEAYEYVVNGKPAIEWIMERYKVTVDKASGIKNDPNDWAKEHDEPRYIIDLLKRVVTVSLETMKIVKSLPKLEEK